MTQRHRLSVRGTLYKSSALTMLMVCVAFTGCDKVESFVNDAKQDVGGSVAPPPAQPEAASPPTQQAITPMPIQPVGPTPDSLLADLKSRSAFMIDDALLQAVANAPDAAKQVTELNLSSNLNITGAGLAAVGKFSNLARLQINGVGKVESGEFGVLQTLTSLVELEADGTRIGNDTIPLLAQLTQLKKLSLVQTPLQGSALAQLDALKSLEELRVDETAIDDSALASLAGLPLRKLSVSRTRVTAAGIVHIGNHSTLESLNVSETQVPGAAFAKAKFPALKVLIAGKTAFGVDGVINARRFPKLEELWLFQSGLALDNGTQWDRRADFKTFPALRVLNVGNNQLSDLGLSRLIAGTKTLEELYVNQHQAITDRGLAELLKCKSLKLLDVSQTSVSAAGMQALKQKMPELVVVNGETKLQ